MMHDFITFEFLADRPAAIPVVAEWYFREWGRIDPGGSVAKTVERIGGKLNRDGVPLHLIAVRRNEVVGVAQLKGREMDIYPEREFWLGGLFVVPESRGRGVGYALCEKAVEVAKGLGIEELFLQTEALDGGLYRRLGWKVVVDRVCYHGVEVAVMRWNLRLDAMRGEATAAFFGKLAGLPWREEMGEWAVNCLVRGLQGTATTLLAGVCAEDDREVFDLFRKAVAEQGIELPGPDFEYVGCGAWLCGEIAEGRIAARRGLRLLNQLWIESKYDSRFADWVGLEESILLMEEGLVPLDGDVTPEGIDRSIVREAIAVVGGRKRGDGGSAL